MAITESAPHDSADGPSVDAFLRRLTAATGGGMFLDGFVFASVAAVIASGTFVDDLKLDSTDLGFISASTLVGTIIGSPGIGYLTDKVGRKPMFMFDLAIFLVAALLMLGVTSMWEVVTLGVFLGIAIGGDYSIGSPLLGEFAPARRRGHYLGLLEILWNVGYVIAFLVGYLILRSFPSAWHIVLASAAVPAGVILLLRHGLPESPRWLISKGRTEEARQVLAEVGEEDQSAEFQDETSASTRWQTLFDREYIGRTVFASVFWICIVIPYFGLTFFQSEVLGAIGLNNPVVGALIGTCVALVGASIGWFLVDRVGRRKILLTPMFATGVFLALVGLSGPLHMPVGVTVASFFGYLLFYGVMSILPGVYPLEVFPTAVRTTGMGFASAMSRVGATAGTFLLPIGLDAYGLGPVLIALAIVCFIGWVVSLVLAPETAGKLLTETGSPQGTGRDVVRGAPPGNGPRIAPAQP